MKREQLQAELANWADVKGADAAKRRARIERELASITIRVEDAPGHGFACRIVGRDIDGAEVPQRWAHTWTPRRSNQPGKDWGGPTPPVYFASDEEVLYHGTERRAWAEQTARQIVERSVALGWPVSLAKGGM